MSFAGAVVCDERCHPIVQVAAGIPYVAFVVFPGMFVALQGWVTVAVIVGFWGMVGAAIGASVAARRAPG